MSALNVCYLGTIKYGDALAIQEKLHALRVQNRIGDTLLLLEHTPVLTLGTRGDKNNILLPISELEAMGAEIFEASRGGDVTYHGPGQIVGYPIMDLNLQGRDVKAFIGRIQETFIALLKSEFGIDACTDDKKYTGVWVGNNKITAIGIAVRRAVTMHGFAFNINTDMSHFKWINPCGITDRGVTSLALLTGRKQDMARMHALTAEYFCAAFGAECRITEAERLICAADERD